MERKKKIKAVIAVLAVLLAVNLVALAVTAIYVRMSSRGDTVATLPENIITPETDSGENSVSDSRVPGGSPSGSVHDTALKQTAASIVLYNKQPQDNTAFAIENMFPGDSETEYYGVSVSYHNEVTVNFKAETRSGYEKLSEVMKLKVTLLTTGQTLYEGLMRDMPQSITYKLSSAEGTTDELYYEITASLDTAVGNDYQNKALAADFKWWITETENLDKAPYTGDLTGITLWTVMLAVSALVLLLAIRRKKKEGQNG